MKNINTLVHEIKVILDKNPKNGIPLYWTWKFLSECQKYGFQILPSNFYSPIPEKSMLDNFYIENDKKEIYDHPTIFDKKKIENFLLMLLLRFFYQRLPAYLVPEQLFQILPLQQLEAFSFLI